MKLVEEADAAPSETSAETAPAAAEVEKKLETAAAAETLLPDVSEGFAEEPKEGGASEPVPTDDAKAKSLRLAELEARVERLKTRNRERAESKKAEEIRTNLARKEQEIAKAREEAEAQRNLWKSSVRDPLKAFKELGIEPAKAYEQITNAMLARETPEAKEEQFRERLYSEFKKEFEPKLSEVETLKAELENLKRRDQEREHFALLNQQRSAERDFLGTVARGGYDELADYYEDDELIEMGNLVAVEFAQKRKPFTVKDVADELSARLIHQLRRAEERRKKRLASVKSNAAQAVPETDTAAASKDSKAATKTVTNDLAATTASTVKKKLTDEERRRLAIAQLEQMERGR